MFILSFDSLTEDINKIIKSKWEMLEEMDIALPSVSKVANDLICKKINESIESFLRERWNIDRYTNCFVYPEVDGNKVHILYMTDIGPVESVEFTIEPSAKFQGVAKTVSVNIFRLPDDATLADVFNEALMMNKDSDIYKLWTMLPIKVKEKEHNLICPKCGDRNRVYVGNYGNYYAMTCSSCDFVGKRRTVKYEVLDNWTKEKSSDFRKARTYAIKHQNFKDISSQSVEIIKDELNKLATLKQNKKVAYTDDDIKKLKESLLASLNNAIDELFDR